MAKKTQIASIGDEVTIKWGGKDGLYKGQRGRVVSTLTTARGRQVVYALTADPHHRRPGYDMMLLLDARTEIKTASD